MAGDFNPFDPDRLVGTVTQVTGAKVHINLPSAADSSPKRLYGSLVPGGVVGEFVVIESAHIAVLGRIETVRLPERDRLEVEKQRISEHRDAHPVGEVLLMASLNMASGEVEGGVTSYPRVGAQVFSADPKLLQHAAQSLESGPGIELATLLADKSIRVTLNPNDLHSRHCAIVGTTGGGKSFTLAQIIGEGLKFKYKTILIDATGEFTHLGLKSDVDASDPINFDSSIRHLTFGRKKPHERCIRFPYTRLQFNDFEILFTPSGQSQSPKLREAVRSLLLAKQVHGEDKVYIRVKRKVSEVEGELKAHRHKIEFLTTEFDIKLLSKQIVHECYKADNNNADTKYVADFNGLSYVQSLITRIEAVINTTDFECLFNKEYGDADFFDEIADFLADKSLRVLRLNLSELADEFDAQAIVVNAIARSLLKVARSKALAKCPIVLAVDEAHRFTEKATGDSDKFRMNQLELVGKMGRKDGLYLLIATQRPRDLGPGILSQVGAVIAHRLTHRDDREAIERLAGEFDKNAVGMLANLASGQAVVTGINFPVPVTVKINRARFEPLSDSPPLDSAEGFVSLLGEPEAGIQPEEVGEDPFTDD